MSEDKQPNLMGQYGDWFSNKLLGEIPGKHSFRSGNWKNITEWRQIARTKLLDCLAPIDLGATPTVTIESTIKYNGLHIEKLSWQLPYGPRTEAVFLKPEGSKNKLPGVLGLHDHGGNKYIGWRKIAKTSDDLWEIQSHTHNKAYEGLAWANQLASNGYAVLVHDAFSFGSRKIRIADLPNEIRGSAIDAEPTDIEGVAKNIAFHGNHESILMKGILCSGTTFPGVYAKEDQMALNILSQRNDVDEERLGCGGLSGGGMRTVYLTGIDDRIKCSVAAGFMTTWRDFLLNKAQKHTWMAYTPLLPKELDFPEILSLNKNAANLVLNCVDDPLFTLSEMKRADEILREFYSAAKETEKYNCTFHPGVHKFDSAMQTEAFAWYDKFLKN